MAIKRTRALKIAKEAIEALNKNIVVSKAYIFGSYINGKPTQWSDIDLAIVSPAYKGIRFLDYKLTLPHIKDKTNLLEIHPFSSKEFSSKNLFAKEIMKHGLRIK